MSVGKLERTKFPKVKKHDVRIDYAGFNQDRQRFTCHTAGCGGATIVVQPWMSAADWMRKYDEFAKAHPHDAVKP